MYNYTIIDSDAGLRALLERWRQEKITRIGMDFEGEFNLHIYGEHLCLIQLYDSHDFYVVDPFTVSTGALKDFLESEDVEKIMFDCASDSSLVRKQYGIQLKNICDVRVMAMALGFMGNLAGLIERYAPQVRQQQEDTGSKKKNQMTNWMKRPLRQAQLAYALEDVAHLFILREALSAEVVAEGLEESVSAQMVRAPLPKGPEKPGWEKLTGWKYLNRIQRLYVREFFCARDAVAQAHNVPAARILDKKQLVSLAKIAPLSRSSMERELARSQASGELLPLMLDAQEKVAGS